MDTNDMYTYYLYGLTFSFPFPCHGFYKSDQAPDVMVEIGRIDAGHIDWKEEGVCYKVSSDFYLLSAPNIGRFFVAKGANIVIESEKGVPNEALLLFLVNIVSGALLFQRKYFVLQGSAIERNGAVFAFLGKSAGGKSLLAAVMQEKGYRIVTDSVCAIKTDTVPLIYPGYPFLLLWRDSLKRLGKEKNTFREVRNGLGRFWAPNEKWGTNAPLPLKALFKLHRENCEKVEFKELLGFRKVFAIRSSAYHASLVKGMEQEKPFFQECERASRHLVVEDLDIPYFLRDINKIADDLDLEISRVLAKT